MQLFRTREEVLDSMSGALRASVHEIDHGETLEDRERERCAIVGVVKYYLSQLDYFRSGPTLENLSKANAVMMRRLAEIATGEAYQPAIHAEEILNAKCGERII